MCITSKNVCTATISFASDKRFVPKSTGKKPTFSRNKITKISGVEGFRESLQMEGISNNAQIERGSYNGRQVNPFQAPIVNYIINYQSEKFDKGLQYRTMNF